MIAFLFPGQGSQYVGMGKEFFSEFPLAKETFEEASDSIGLDMESLCFDSDPKELSLTANAQPAILTTSIALLRVLNNETDIKPNFVSGHSLGEYSALVANSCIKLADAVYVVRKRGEFMQEAVPVGVGGMAAILGLSGTEVNDICENVSDESGVVSPANYNSPSQIVISGNKEYVEKASDIAKEKGAKRAIPLDVSAPFHCELMYPAALRLKEVLDKIEFNRFDCPLVTNVEAKSNEDETLVNHLLVEQVTSPVRWTDSVNYLRDAGVDQFIEIGPSNVLSGLIKRTLSDVIIKNLEKPDQLNHIKEIENGTEK